MAIWSRKPGALKSCPKANSFNDRKLAELDWMPLRTARISDIGFKNLMRVMNALGLDLRVTQLNEESRLRLSSSFKSATHIVKFWDAAEYRELARRMSSSASKSRSGLSLLSPNSACRNQGMLWLSNVSISEPMARISGSKIFVCSMAFLHRVNTTADTKPDFLGAQGNSFARWIGKSPDRPVQIVRPELRNPQRRCSSQKLWHHIFGCRRRRTTRAGLRFNHDDSLHTGRRDGAHSGWLQEVAGSPGADLALRTTVLGIVSFTLPWRGRVGSHRAKQDARRGGGSSGRSRCSTPPRRFASPHERAPLVPDPSRGG